MDQQSLSCHFSGMNKISLDYRSFILREFEKRKSKNPKYSLRAFARDVGTATSRLSEILKGKAGLSPEKAALYSDKLGLTGEEKVLFLNMVDAQHARSEMARQMAQRRLQEYIANYSQLDMDQISLVTDWYHFAILESLNLSYSDHSPERIADFFNLSVEKVNQALERLSRLELIEKKGDRWFPKQRLRETTTDIPSKAIREMHKELLEKGIAALEEQSVENRDFKAYIFSFHKADMPFVKKRLDNFQEELAAQMDLTPNKDSVYCLLFNLFELSNPERTSSND